MNKAVLKNAAVMVAAIFAAGLLMNQFQSNTFVADARKGYTG